MENHLLPDSLNALTRSKQGRLCALNPGDVRTGSLCTQGRHMLESIFFFFRLAFPSLFWCKIIFEMSFLGGNCFSICVCFLFHSLKIVFNYLGCVFT